jgi:hypothetical protein
MLEMLDFFLWQPHWHYCLFLAISWTMQFLNEELWVFKENCSWHLWTCVLENWRWHTLGDNPSWTDFLFDKQRLVIIMIQPINFYHIFNQFPIGSVELCNNNVMRLCFDSLKRLCHVVIALTFHLSWFQMHLLSECWASMCYSLNCSSFIC